MPFDPPSPAPAEPSLETQIGEDFKTIQDICERLAPLVQEGKYSPALDATCRALKQACHHLQGYQYHL